MAGDELERHEGEQCRDHAEIAVVMAVVVGVIPIEGVRAVGGDAATGEVVVGIGHGGERGIHLEIEPGVAMDEGVRQPLVLLVIHPMHETGVQTARFGHGESGDGDDDRRPCHDIAGDGEVLPHAPLIDPHPVDAGTGAEEHEERGECQLHQQSPRVDLEGDHRIRVNAVEEHEIALVAQVAHANLM